MRDRLRRIRLAADEARNWDVMCERFIHGGNVPAAILEQVKARRREAQGPIVAIYQEITADACQERSRHGPARSNPNATARENAGSDGRPLSTSFRLSRSSSRPPSPTLPRTRRCTHFASARRSSGTRWRSWPWPSTRLPQKLYRQVTLFQDLLGTVNDHATAKWLFQDWRSKSEDLEQRAFLDGLLLSEERATRSPGGIPGCLDAAGRGRFEAAVPHLLREVPGIDLQPMSTTYAA